MGFIFMKNPSLSESQINFIKTFIFFNTFNKVFQIKFTKKQSNNIISGIHAFSSLFLSGSNNIKDLKWFTSAYFVYDLFYSNTFLPLFWNLHLLNKPQKQQLCH